MKKTRELRTVVVPITIITYTYPEDAAEVATSVLEEVIEEGFTEGGIYIGTPVVTLLDAAALDAHGEDLPFTDDVTDDDYESDPGTIGELAEITTPVGEGK